MTDARAGSSHAWRALALLLATAACGPKEDAPPVPDEYVVDCETLTGDAGPGAAFASDENYAAFVNAEAANKLVHMDCKAPLMSAPQSGGSISISSPPTVTFAPTPPTCDLGAPSAAGRAVLACRWHRPTPSFLARAWGVVEGTAEAHCGAFTGENYLLEITAPGESKPVYMAMLSVTTYTPDAAVWQKAMSGRAGQTLSLTIERAVFFRGDINEGPYMQTAPYTFTVAP